jgi:hypothetical protein
MNESRDLGDPRRNARPVDAMGHRVFWELRHARLRLAIAENDLAWVQELLVTGDIAPDDALVILDETMDDLSGVRP